MEDLSNITAVSIITDNKYGAPCTKALQFCSQQIKFGAIKLICPQENSGEAFKDITQIVSCIEWPNYSPWILKNLTDYIDTDYCLIIQYDGFIINPNLWNNSFLDYDYIGAIWPDVAQINRVGNGGFSLRSKKFLDLSSKIEYKQKRSGGYSGEDWVACVENYDYMVKGNGVKFPDLKVARSFSVEHTMTECEYNKEELVSYKSFGFHDKSNRAAMKLIHG